MEITSVNNDLVKETVKLQQKKYRTEKFLLEGFKAIEEAFNAGIKIDYAFVADKKVEEYSFLGEKVISTTEPVLKKVSTTDSAPDAVAVGYKRNYDSSSLKSAKKVILLENIKDLGNLGTILRTAVAFGADAVVLYGESVDLYNPKCVRASVGNLWKIPVIEIKEFSKLKEIFEGFSRIATLPRTNNYLKDFKVDLPCVVMFGSEADGLSDDLIKFATDSIKIEMANTVESLNLSVSCAVVLYRFFVA
ncbi:RNA methyltransferase [bacterium]|nr:RNA methyltransferase [bacterium]